jgi:amino acid permease
MLKNFLNSYAYPVATIAGSIIGVGFLSLPYLAVQVGFLPMMAYFIVLSALVLFIHQIFGQVCLKTPDYKRWPGFVGFYFGPLAKRAMLGVMAVSSLGVLLAYLIVGSRFLAAIFQPFFGGGNYVYACIYWGAAAVVIYFGVTMVSRLELAAIILLLCALGVIFAKGMGVFSMANLVMPSQGFSLSNVLLPYGPILFSLWGTGLIPEAEEMARGKKRNLKAIVAAGTLVPAAIYLFFIVMVVGITGSNTTESALIGVRGILGDGMISLTLLVGVITTFTACIAMGLLLKKIFIYDAQLPHGISFSLVMLPPLILFLLGIHSFLAVISFIGGFMLGIDGILILLMYLKIGGKKIIAIPLMSIFIIGMVYSAMSVL